MGTTVKSFNPKYVKRELTRIDKTLLEKIKIYVTGGAVMALAGLKIGTKDIDVIVESDRAMNNLVSALLEERYYTVSGARLLPPYEGLSAMVLENKQGFRWDIFLKIVARKLFLSSGMKKRATLMFQGRRLIVYRLSREDIFLLKGVTERDRDLDDMYILSRSGLSYDVIFKECKHQSRKSGRIWESALFGQCEDLRKKYDVEIPFLMKLRRLAEEKILQSKILERIQDGSSTREAIQSDLKGLLSEDLEFGLELLVERRQITFSGNKITLTSSTKKHQPSSL